MWRMYLLDNKTKGEKMCAMYVNEVTSNSGIFVDINVYILLH